MHFEPGHVLVAGIVDPRASVVVEGPLLAFWRFGSGGHGGRALLRGQLRARGAVRHQLLLVRVRRLLGEASSL